MIKASITHDTNHPHPSMHTKRILFGRLTLEQLSNGALQFRDKSGTTRVIDHYDVPKLWDVLEHEVRWAECQEEHAPSDSGVTPPDDRPAHVIERLIAGGSY